MDGVDDKRVSGKELGGEELQELALVWGESGEGVEASKTL